MRKVLPLLLTLATCIANAQQKTANYDEAKIVPYTLPELLVSQEGKPVTTAEAWTNLRRAEVLKLFEDHVYGRTPANWGKVSFKTLEVKKDALGGKATRKLVHISLPDYQTWAGMEVMLYIPNGLSKPAPCFAGLSFGGNHAVSTEPDLPLSTRWMRPNKEKSIVDNKATEASRGNESSRWALEMIVGQGFAVATAYYGDIEPDHAEGWKDGLRAALSKDGDKTEWKDGEWGAIGAWAWGLSRILDYLETDSDIDAKHCAVIGHSRLGKTSLWAGAQDQRFAFVISNNSGEGGAATMRRDFGETTTVITKAFPHWFTKTYTQYAGNAAACPVDQHMLIALAAPRPIYIASAAEDQWADPKGEFLSGLNAESVYALFGKKGYGGVKEHPAIDKPIGDTIGYHIRTGKHDVTDFDWEQYLKFAKRHFQE
ncbi:MAG: acetylxylan esterase [Prosthecobacter sp.]|nr:acetylxylan esterase [Prosthecobacter sp.]